MTHGGVHVQDDIDAPAVLDPGREIGVVNSGGSPQECAVTGLAAERLLLLFIRLAHDLDDLTVNLVEVRIGAVYGCPCIQAIERLGNAAQSRIRGLEVVPLFKLDGVLLVHELCVLKEIIPVVLDAVLFFHESDGVLEHLGGIRMCARLVVDHGQGYGEVRHAYAAALEHGGSLGCVAGHVGRDHRLTDEGECVVERNAGLGRAA